MILKIDPNNPEPEKISKVVDILRYGGIIAYPTDTIYGLGCDVFNKTAINKIYKIKERSLKQLFSFICSNFKQIGDYAVVSNETFRIMKRVLPGPFTFILTASNNAPKNVIEKKRRTVGVRIPDNKICLDIVNLLEKPIISTSINQSGESSINDPYLIEQKFGKDVGIIVDGGILCAEPSTIIDASTEDLQILRQGKGKLREIYESVEK